jgi:hypothetical protein
MDDTNMYQKNTSYLSILMHTGRHSVEFIDDLTLEKRGLRKVDDSIVSYGDVCVCKQYPRVKNHQSKEYRL